MRRFAVVHQIDSKGWFLKVQGVRDTVLMPYTEKNFDSELSVDTIIIADVQNNEGVWVAVFYESIRKPLIQENGREILAWEMLNRSLEQFAQYGIHLTSEPMFIPGKGIRFAVADDDFVNEGILMLPNGDMVDPDDPDYL